jgi:hypothetical protein
MTTKEQQLCDNLFKCSTPAEVMLVEAMQTPGIINNSGIII